MFIPADLVAESDLCLKYFALKLDDKSSNVLWLWTVKDMFMILWLQRQASVEIMCFSFTIDTTV